MAEVKQKSFETSFAKSWIDKEGIAHIYFKHGAQINSAQVVEYLQDAEKISGGKAVPVLFDIRDVGFVYEQALNQMLHNKESLKLTKATAILVDNPPMRITLFINFALKLKGAPFPMKSFFE